MNIRQGLQPVLQKYGGKFLALGLWNGCAVITVADTVVVTAATVVKTGVKATGAVIGAVIPEIKIPAPRGGVWGHPIPKRGRPKGRGIYPP